jgi:hypothetical protein
MESPARGDQPKHDVKQLEARIKELTTGFRRLADDTEFEELFRIIPKPGWTTPAEFLFAMGVADSMLAQTKLMMASKKLLLEGSRAVITK